LFYAFIPRSAQRRRKTAARAAEAPTAGATKKTANAVKRAKKKNAFEDATAEKATRPSQKTATIPSHCQRRWIFWENDQ
jgi:hypothetical protein